MPPIDGFFLTGTSFGPSQKIGTVLQMHATSGLSTLDAVVFGGASAAPTVIDDQNATVVIPPRARVAALRLHNDSGWYVDTIDFYPLKPLAWAPAAAATVTSVADRVSADIDTSTSTAYDARIDRTVENDFGSAALFDQVPNKSGTDDLWADVAATFDGTTPNGTGPILATADQANFTTTGTVGWTDGPHVERIMSQTGILFDLNRQYAPPPYTAPTSHAAGLDLPTPPDPPADPAAPSGAPNIWDYEYEGVDPGDAAPFVVNWITGVDITAACVANLWDGFFGGGVETYYAGTAQVFVIPPGQFEYDGVPTHSPRQGRWFNSAEIAGTRLADSHDYPAGSVSDHFILTVTLSVGDEIRWDVINGSWAMLLFCTSQMTGGPDNPSVDGEGSTTSFGLDPAVTQPLSITWHYTRPRWRYLVPQYGGTPRLRQHPRDDYLAGAPRQGRVNQPKSVQASSRQGWAGTYR